MLSGLYHSYGNSKVKFGRERGEVQGLASVKIVLCLFE